MHEHPRQDALEIRGTPLLECERVDVVPENIRLYWKKAGEISGFHFFVAQFACAAHDPAETRPYMDRPGTQVECLFHGDAYFDGVRHLWVGDEASDNEGYLYYVGPKSLVAVFSALAELEKKHCPNID